MDATLIDECKQAYRVSDLVSEPRRMLEPIQGYEGKPLVSLEEAVKPLVSIVAEVKRMVWTVKQNCRESKDDLTSDESASIMLYSLEWHPKEKSFYNLLNATLRTDDRDKLIPWFLYLRLMITALSKLPQSCLTVYRGVKMDLRAEYQKGQSITWWGFSSCTLSVEVLESDCFLGKTGPRTLFTIQCDSGMDISRYLFYSHENEVLLLPGRQFTVVSCYDSNNGLSVVHMKETLPPYPLIHPIAASKSETQTLLTPISQVNSASSSEPEPKLIQQHSELLEKIAQYPNHSKIDLQTSSLSDEDMDTVVNEAIMKKKCTVLKLLGTNIIDEGVKIIASALQYNKTLIILDFWNNTIRSDGARCLADALRTNTTLTKLFIVANYIGDKGVQYLADALKTNRTLKKLVLGGPMGGNQIGDQGACYLAESLHKNTSLTTLDLSINEIGDVGADCFANVLRQNTTLKVLNLDDNQIGHYGVRDLVDALEENTTLKNLYVLGGNPISDWNKIKRQDPRIS